jgi:hydrogenase/urease accessory protein HupE
MESGNDPPKTVVATRRASTTVKIKPNQVTSSAHREANHRTRYIYTALMVIGILLTLAGFILPLMSAGGWDEPISESANNIMFSLMGLGIVIILSGCLFAVLTSRKALIPGEAVQTYLPYADHNLQRRAGFNSIVHACVFGTATVVLLLVLSVASKSANDFIRGLLCLIVPLFLIALAGMVEKLGTGLGILLRGVPFDPPWQFARRRCPHCYHELRARDLPTPGYSAKCPKCGSIFTREDW